MKINHAIGDKTLQRPFECLCNITRPTPFTKIYSFENIFNV